MQTNRCTRSTFIKSNNVPPGKLSMLCTMLSRKGSDEPWKLLASHIKRRNGKGHRFTNDDVHQFASTRDPPEALLNSWATDRPTLGLLCDTLTSIGLKAAAEFVRVDILGEKPAVNLGAASKTGTHSVINESTHHCAAAKEGCLLGEKPAVNLGPASETESDSVIDESTHHCAGSKEGSLLEAGPSSVKTLSYSELRKWTDNFNSAPLEHGGRLLGKGGFGEVYLGKPDNAPAVAVKKINDDQNSSSRSQFTAEIHTFLNFSHENLLRLLGFCDEGNSLCLVCDYLPEGSVEERLACKSNKPPLTAKQRIVIAQGTARGVLHLHKNGFLHRDIKTANILLNAELCPVVGDFGLARSAPDPMKTSIQTDNIIGTTVYMAPEYMSRGRLNEKSDAYSFGVVLLELLTGQPAYDTSREDVDIISYIESFDPPHPQAIDEKAGQWIDSEKMLNLAWQEHPAKCFVCREKHRLSIEEAMQEIDSWKS